MNLKQTLLSVMTAVGKALYNSYLLEKFRSDMDYTPEQYDLFHEDLAREFKTDARIVNYLRHEWYTIHKDPPLDDDITSAFLINQKARLREKIASRAEHITTLKTFIARTILIEDKTPHQVDMRMNQIIKRIEPLHGAMRNYAKFRATLSFVNKVKPKDCTLLLNARIEDYV